MPTPEQIQEILTKHFGSGYTVNKVDRLENTEGYSSLSHLESYLIDLEYKGKPYLSFLTVSLGLSSHFHNSLATVASLIDLIRANTPIPLTPPLVDFTLQTIPHEYLITTPAGPTVSSSHLIPLPQAKTKLNLSEKESGLIDLKIGALLGKLHTLVQNDWFGRPSIIPPKEPSYSWQETFMLLFDEALLRAVSSDSQKVIPVQEINRHMSRAIAFFLFDDVEVPSLVWFTGSSTDVYLVLEPLPDGTQSLDLAAIIPTLGNALWGDPLLETFFMESKGVLEGSGEQLLVFPRQKTKRIWYSLYLALIVLVDQKHKREWALQTIKESVGLLKEAPCY